MARNRRKSGQPDQQDQPKRNPLLRALTADLALRAGSYALRHAVSSGLVRGKAAAAVPDHPPAMSTRVLTAAASAVATRSVPGALLVATGILARTLYRRGKTRQEERARQNAATGAIGTLPPV
ncbi:MAG: hypothetical protein ABIT10_12405 [Alteraurantiacibacter sp.]